MIVETQQRNVAETRDPKRFRSDVGFNVDPSRVKKRNFMLRWSYLATRLPCNLLYIHISQNSYPGYPQTASKKFSLK